MVFQHVFNFYENLWLQFDDCLYSLAYFLSVLYDKSFSDAEREV